MSVCSHYLGASALYQSHVSALNTEWINSKASHLTTAFIIFISAFAHIRKMPVNWNKTYKREFCFIQKVTCSNVLVQFIYIFISVHSSHMVFFATCTWHYFLGSLNEPFLFCLNYSVSLCVAANQIWCKYNINTCYSYSTSWREQLFCLQE